MKLDPQTVNAIFLDCLLRDEEMVEGKPKPEVPIVFSEGLTVNAGFHKDRVQSHAEEITGLLAELPDTFKEGMSFLNMCNDRHGHLWTGVHQTMQELVLLGQAVGKMQLCAPRELWPMLPGGMPYYQVTL